MMDSEEQVLLETGMEVPGGQEAMARYVLYSVCCFVLVNSLDPVCTWIHVRLGMLM